jgi:hypothetical protein
LGKRRAVKRRTRREGVALPLAEVYTECAKNIVQFHHFLSKSGGCRALRRGLWPRIPQYRSGTCTGAQIHTYAGTKFQGLKKPLQMINRHDLVRWKN